MNTSMPTIHRNTGQTSTKRVHRVLITPREAPPFLALDVFAWFAVFELGKSLALGNLIIFAILDLFTLLHA
jgi:hypothetical protein